MLSASDAGRIGRLVLPKKCAEAYFPPISNPEGLPIKVQDLKGKEWMFQFRFWPNNNSRMYVLEGVTPCIHSMQLQAGDIDQVCHLGSSFLLPVGVLLNLQAMGSSGNRSLDLYAENNKSWLTRKHGSEAWSNGNSVATNGNVSTKSTKFSEEVLANSSKKGFSSTTHVAAADSKSARAETKMSDDLVKESLETIVLFVVRGRVACQVQKKRPRIDKEDLVELKVTVVQAQGLMRPPLSGAPTVIVIEG
ncbi:hypothetical protein HAX54_012802 [Datura stramonium]|uniref:TF-B3 domain-containing protein n=1 Tax=Datura stramonium TaxID=4076 RepID=A0ABS8TKD1_DATST|nr:hypothetical protein [Datura stramonium]